MGEEVSRSTQDIDLRLISIEQSQSPRSRLYRGLEVAAYVLGGAGVIVGLGVLAFCGPDNLWNGVSGAGVGFTLVGVGVALSIYRVQADQSSRESARTQLVLNEIGSHARLASKNSIETRDIVSELSRSREAAQAESEPAAESVEPTDTSPVEDGQESEDVTANDGGNIVRVDGDGEYRAPGAVPLYVLADLVRWWPEPKYSYQRWTVDNLVGAYRRFNTEGQLTGVPWIVTFRRSSGELVNYRLSYAGRGQGPSISIYSAERNRWQDLEQLQ